MSQDSGVTVLLDDAERNLRGVGGWDNSLVNVPAGGVRKLIQDLRAALATQPEAAQPNLVDDEGVMNTPLLRAARLLVSGSHPSKDCAGPYMVPADLWLTLQAEVMESLRQAAARDLANPAQPEAAPADDVLEALELSPETFRTEGGVINKGKLRAAILHPYNYLPQDHWMQARFSKPGGRPLSEAAPAVQWKPPPLTCPRSNRSDCALFGTSTGINSTKENDHG